MSKKKNIPIITMQTVQTADEKEERKTQTTREDRTSNEKLTIKWTTKFDAKRTNKIKGTIPKVVIAEKQKAMHNIDVRRKDKFCC